MKEKSRFGLHGKLTAKAGKRDELVSILVEASKLMHQLKTCLLYAVSIDPKDENSVWVTEIWDKKEDHDQSLSMPEVRALIGNAIPILDGNPESGQELIVLNSFLYNLDTK